MKLATIERILELQPIENADKIVLAKILGWDVIVKKDEFLVGDLCVYIPIDTLVDPSIKCFNFLANSKKPTEFVRIKTTKFRGVWSQGLALPINCLPVHPNEELVESTDVSIQLGVKKYEKENIIVSNGVTTKFVNFPDHYISKTDEDNLKTMYKTLNEFIGKQVYITQKMDGSSMTLIWDGIKEQFLICSRNLIVESGSIMAQYVDNVRLKEKIINYGNSLAIQGEFSGPKINGNKMGLKNYEFYVFTIKNLDTNNYYGYDDIITITNALSIKMVPIIGIYDIDDTWTIEKFQLIANSQEYNKKVPGEGIVVRPIQPIFSHTLGKMLSVKIINQNYRD